QLAQDPSTPRDANNANVSSTGAKRRVAGRLPHCVDRALAPIGAGMRDCGPWRRPTGTRCYMPTTSSHARPRPPSGIQIADAALSSVLPARAQVTFDYPHIAAVGASTDRA